jgi:gliding motility-associated-like protein
MNFLSKNNRKRKRVFFFLIFYLFLFIKLNGQVGTLTGTGMSVCSLFSFSICPSQTITPLNYGNQGYACSGTSMPDVSFTTMGAGWRVMKNNWKFTSNVSGRISGFDNLGNYQSFPFSATNTITPMSYSGNFIQFAVNGNLSGPLLNQTTFSISLNSAVFGANTYTYCPNSSSNITISPVLPTEGGPWTYTWQPGNFSGSSISVSPTSSSIYTVTSASSAGCISKTSVSVTMNCPTAPLCSGNLGTPVFFEDFGSGSALYGPALPPGVTNYIYQTGNPPNGTYVISSSSNPSGVNLGYVADGDHTGNTNGYMMVVNSDYPATEVFRKLVTGLCPNTAYVFSSYLSNNNTPSTPTSVCPGYVYANVRVQTEFPTGTIQNSITTGNLPLGLSNTALNWKEYGFVFTTLPGQTSVEVVLKNNAPGGCGNDYVVDDISLSPCGPAVSLSIVPNQTVFCSGDSVRLKSIFTSGNYINTQYQWQHSVNGGVSWINIPGATNLDYFIPSVSSNQSGLYQLLVSENGNINSSSCRIKAGPISFSVTSSFVGVSQPTICSGNPTTLTATGATSYSWSTGAVSNSIVVNPSTTTSYTVVGSNGTCSNQAVSTVSVVPGGTISITGNTLICKGQSTTLSATGASGFSWSTGATTSSIIVSPTITTSYSITPPPGSCISPTLVTVNVLSAPSMTVSGNTGICNLQTTTLTANGATGYSWTTGATSASIIVNPTATTSYSVIGAISTCTSQIAVTVTVNTVPIVSQLNFSNSDCGMSNGTATLSVLPVSSTFLWDNGATTNSVGNLSAGVHSVTISNNGCETQTDVSIQANPAPSIISSSVDPTSCGLANGSATVNATPSGSTFNWSSGISSTSNSAQGLPGGSYTVTAVNGACQTSTVINILSSVGVQIITASVVPSSCIQNDGSITVSDNGTNPVYSWSPGIFANSNVVTGLSAGTYSLVIADGSCSTQSVFVVALSGGPTGLNVIKQNAICKSANGSIDIINVVNGDAPFLYSINNGTYNNVSTFTNLGGGSYTVSVRDGFGCIYSQTYTVSIDQHQFTISQTIKSTSCDSDDGEVGIHNIQGGSSPYLFSFNGAPNVTDSLFGPLSAGTYSLNIVDMNKCTTGFSIIVPENGEDYTLYVPNTFTPNTDIVNDIWYVQGTCLGEFNCTIYNRWGEKIIELNDLKEGWNGKYKEKDVPEGVYVFTLTVQTKTGQVRKSGHITVFR